MASMIAVGTTPSRSPTRSTAIERSVQPGVAVEPRLGGRKQDLEGIDALDVRRHGGSTLTFRCMRTSPIVPRATTHNHRWHIWSLDVDGVRVVIQNGDFAGTLPEDLAEMHAIIVSIQIPH